MFNYTKGREEISLYCLNTNINEDESHGHACVHDDDYVNMFLIFLSCQRKQLEPMSLKTNPISY